LSKELLMPKLGLTMTEGTLIRWYYEEGEEISQGDILYDIETEKITHSIEANQDGFLAKILVEEGEVVPVQAVVGILAAEGEELQETDKIDELDEEDGNAETEIEREILRASPRAKMVARENDVDLEKVREITDRFRITSEDVNKYISQHQDNKSEVKLTEKKEKNESKVELSKYRKKTAERLSQSWQAPHIYLRSSVDLSELLALQEKYRELAIGERPSLNTMIVKITAHLLKKHPHLNAHFKNDEYILKEDINLGIAVAVEEGLVVPVIKQANQYSLTELNSNIKELVNKSKADELRLDNLEDGSFTISNLGMFGVEEFTAILNPPQVGILAVGTIIDKISRNESGEIMLYPAIELTLGLDHRAVDGAQGAQFLQDLKRYLENPLLII